MSPEVTQPAFHALDLAVVVRRLGPVVCLRGYRITQLIQGKRTVTSDTALRLDSWFGINPQFWMNLQSQCDLASARKAAGEQIEALPTAAEPGADRR